MRHCLLGLTLTAAVFLGTGHGQEKADPTKSDPKKGVFLTAEEGGLDYARQGEFTGLLAKDKWGAQVVARGEGKFDIYFLAGGLPGDGWDTKTRTKVEAKTADDKTTFSAAGWSGTLTKDKLAGKKDGEEFIFTAVARTSPTVGMKPPEGAVVLFDGTNADAWNGGKIVEDKLLFCGPTTKKKYAIAKLHVEFRLPFQPKAGGQGRGNSGVYLNGDEIQVLDSFGLKGENNECGAFYSKQKPAVNMCLPPLVWQTYDVEIVPGETNLLATVKHNGVLVHEKYAIGTKNDAPVGINLQNHGNPVMFRNIWIVERK
jgi:hypothetical protein